MPTYKLVTGGGVVIRLVDGASIPFSPGNADYEAYLAWNAGGGVPDAADVPTQAALDKQVEINAAAGIARNWFSGQQAAIDFVRLSPTQQATQIDGMSLVQLKVVVKYLAIAVSMVIKRELLD